MRASLGLTIAKVAVAPVAEHPPKSRLRLCDLQRSTKKKPNFHGIARFAHFQVFLDYLPNPLQLLQFVDGQWRANPDAVAYLRRLPQPLCVVSIAGPYRKGKSYLMSRIAGAEPSQGFQLGSEVDSCTQGIWMMAAEMQDDEGDVRQVLILDCEGSGDVQRASADYDVKLWILAALLSSVMILNVVGNLDEPTFQQLEYDLLSFWHVVCLIPL
jgi:hypothetical protein